MPTLELRCIECGELANYIDRDTGLCNECTAQGKCEAADAHAQMLAAGGDAGEPQPC